MPLHNGHNAAQGAGTSRRPTPKLSCGCSDLPVDMGVACTRRHKGPSRPSKAIAHACSGANSREEAVVFVCSIVPQLASAGAKRPPLRRWPAYVAPSNVTSSAFAPLLPIRSKVVRGVAHPLLHCVPGGTLPIGTYMGHVPGADGLRGLHRSPPPGWRWEWPHHLWASAQEPLPLTADIVKRARLHYQGPSAAVVGNPLLQDRPGGAGQPPQPTDLPHKNQATTLD